MRELTLKLTLLHDTTFGRGDGLAGVVDSEVQHDTYGLPYLSGRALKGLLAAEADDILFALDQIDRKTGGLGAARWRAAAGRLFGRPGSDVETVLAIGPARLSADLRAAIAHDVDGNVLEPREVLELLTAIRRQTAMDRDSGAPQKETLRSQRVILRGTVFEASLRVDEAAAAGGEAPPAPDELCLLAACVKALRHAGLGRNRGRGLLKAELYEAGEAAGDRYFACFREALCP